MKGIILAGGKGSRLYPITRSTCKQLLPIYDKPLIYYPLSILMLAGIQDILLISTPEDKVRFEKLFGDGQQYGLSITYAIQNEPRGIAESFIVGEEFIGDEPVALILGDNIFYGHNLAPMLQESKSLADGALIFGYEVQDPERYGVMAFDEHKRLVDIQEKPLRPPSNYAVTGLYFYDNNVIDIAKHLKPSKRGELEITDVNVVYLQNRKLHYRLFERGFAWLDTGTADAMLQASNYVHTIQERQGIKIACIEEIAYQMGYIDEDQLLHLASKLSPSDYSNYLYRIAENFLPL